jgi:hypothetical protein
VTLLVMPTNPDAALVPAGVPKSPLARPAPPATAICVSGRSESPALPRKEAPMLAAFELAPIPRGRSREGLLLGSRDCSIR